MRALAALAAHAAVALEQLSLFLVVVLPSQVQPVDWRLRDQHKGVDQETVAPSPQEASGGLNVCAQQLQSRIYSIAV